MFEKRQAREWEAIRLRKQMDMWERQKRKELRELEIQELREQANPLWGKFT